MTKRITVGNVPVGGGERITVQSMCSSDTRDIKATLAQIYAQHEAGCDITRVAVPDEEAANALREITKKSPLPVVADIHFDHRLAVASAKNGAAKIRINPGNIGGRERVKAVAEACAAAQIPIRIGVNGGSLERVEGVDNAVNMADAALKQAAMLNEFNFFDICLSVKSSSVIETINANRILSKKTDMPLHLGVTEAGTSYNGIIKSAAGIGALLCDGIGDTIRVSLTAPPVEEVAAGIALLKACGLRREGVEIISCPTCGRCRINVAAIANELEQKLKNRTAPLTVAVMGCAVNGPGEARAADIGMAGGKGMGVIFRKGEIVASMPENELCGKLLEYINAM